MKTPGPYAKKARKAFSEAAPFLYAALEEAPAPESTTTKWHRKYNEWYDGRRAEALRMLHAENHDVRPVRREVR